VTVSELGVPSVYPVPVPSVTVTDSAPSALSLSATGWTVIDAELAPTGIVTDDPIVS
jgi:hypothetical protein